MTSIGLPGVDIYTMGGIILVLGFCNIPIVYVNVVHMLRKIPRDMEWAARACGYSQRQAILKINLVSAAPAIAAGSVLAFYLPLIIFLYLLFWEFLLGFRF